MVRLNDNWYRMESDRDSNWRWARSPAVVDIKSDMSQEVCLEIRPAYIHDPNSESNFCDEGWLTIEHDREPIEMVAIQPGEMFPVPLSLQEGDKQLTFSIEAGNFQPGKFGNTDTRCQALPFTN